MGKKKRVSDLRFKFQHWCINGLRRVQVFFCWSFLVITQLSLRDFFQGVIGIVVRWRESRSIEGLQIKCKEKTCFTTGGIVVLWHRVSYTLANTLEVDFKEKKKGGWLVIALKTSTLRQLLAFVYFSFRTSGLMTSTTGKSHHTQ